jgi:glycosyltransferase involved in cell wall biosynthesis
MLKLAVETMVARPPFTYRGFLEYTRRIVEEFRRMAPEFDADVSVYAGSGFATEITGLTATERFRVVYCPLMDNLRRWRFGGGSRQVRRDGMDVLFSPHAETLALPGMPMVLMLHDVDFMRFRQYGTLYMARLYAMHWLTAHTARKIVTNSECSKRDIVRYLKVPEGKVAVIHLGYNHELYNTEPCETLQAAMRARFGLTRRYVLHHGTLQPRKNLRRLVEAYGQLTRQRPKLDWDLVLAGNYGWDCEDVLEACRAVEAPGRVVTTGLLAEAELAALVKGAHLEVIPSLWEGFCFPMVEAMACGVPTMAANNSCFPEVSGGVLEYFDAESVEEMAAAMRRGLEDEELRERLRSEGLKRAAEFSWERCARETLAVIKGTVQRG